jgi:excisionase family DNA binding protein
MMPGESPLSPLVAPLLPHLLEVAHVAHRLSCSQEHVRELIRTGRLSALRFGRRYRIDPVELQAFIDRHRVAAANGGE